MTKPTIFISDMHLSEQTPKLNMLFLQCLHQWRDRIDTLYILGDMFEYWIGDDVHNELIDTLIHEIKQFTQSTPLMIMHGNRDFLLGQVFSNATGAQLIEDPTLITLYGNRYLLTHGDLLCTNDTAYQQFRIQSRNSLWQQAMLAKPIPERIALAKQLRTLSESSHQTQDETTGYGDVTDTGIEQMMAPFCQNQEKPPTMIHGHTHRPAIHDHLLYGKQPFKRYVLQDWNGEHGGYIQISETGIEVKSL